MGASLLYSRALRACLQIITPYNVYFNTKLIFKKGEVWRLLTNFFFFGNLGVGCYATPGFLASLVSMVA